MQRKIVEDKGKFRVKMVDINGNSLGVLPEVFDTEADAQNFMETQPENAAASAPESQDASANTAAPEAATAPESVGTETAPEQAPA